MIEIVGEQRFNCFVSGLAQFRQQIQRQFHVRRDNQLTGISVDVVFSNYFPCDVLNRNFDALNVVFFKLTNMASSDTAAFLDVDFAVSFDIK